MAEHKSDVVVLSRKPMTEMLATCHYADEGGRKGSRDSFVETIGSPRVYPNKLTDGNNTQSDHEELLFTYNQGLEITRQVTHSSNS